MEKTAKIVKVTEKTRTNPEWKTIYYSTVVMDNTDEYPISKGKQTTGFYKEWQSLNYTIEKVGEYDKIVVKEEAKAFWAKPWFAKNYEKDSISMALSYSKDLVVWGKVELSKIYEVADKLHLRMANKYKGETKVEPVVPMTPPKKEIETEIPF